MTIVDIRQLDKAAVLAALYNASKPLGRGFLNPAAGQPMTVEGAAQVLSDAGGDPYFDYLNGRVMKVDLGGDTVDLRLYDRDNGDGTGAAAIAALTRAEAI